MALANVPILHSLGRKFADLVRGDRAVTRLWARRHRDYIELWLLTEPIEGDAERRLYCAAVELSRAYPSADVRLRLLNPRDFEQGDLSELVPAGAEEIGLLES